MRIQSKAAIPQSHTETRSLQFTQAGINIVDSQGTPFLPLLSGGRTSSASIPWQNLLSNLDLFNCWKEVLAAHGIAVPNEAVPQKSSRAWPAKGVDWLTGKAKEERPRQNDPPHDGDANYILVRFIDKNFPTGGPWWSVSQSDHPPSPAHLDAFRSFLNSPEIAGHPYLPQWKAAFDVDKPQMDILAKNIPVFRSCVTKQGTIESVSRRHATTNKRLVVTSNKYEIGPPGSALANPFAEGSGQSVHSRAKSNRAGYHALKQKRLAALAGDEDENEDRTPASTTKTGPSKRKKRAHEGSLVEDDDGDFVLPTPAPMPTSRRRRSKQHKDVSDADTETPASGSRRRPHKSSLMQDRMDLDHDAEDDAVDDAFASQKDTQPARKDKTRASAAFGGMSNVAQPSDNKKRRAEVEAEVEAEAEGDGEGEGEEGSGLVPLTGEGRPGSGRLTASRKSKKLKRTSGTS